MPMNFKTVVVFSSLLLELFIGLFLLWFAFITIAFAGESYRGKMPESAGLPLALLALSSLVIVATAGFCLYLSWNQRSGLELNPAIISFVIFLLGVGINGWAAEKLGGKSLLGMYRQSVTADSESDREIEEARVELEKELTRLRSAVSSGDETLICDLVAQDQSAKTEFGRCRQRIENAQDKWAELQKFNASSGIKAWNFSEPVIPAEHQAWFLRAYFSALMSRPQSLSLAELYMIPRDVAENVKFMEWSDEAKVLFDKELRPRIITFLQDMRSEYASLAEFERSQHELTIKLLKEYSLKRN